MYGVLRGSSKRYQVNWLIAGMTTTAQRAIQALRSMRKEQVLCTRPVWGRESETRS